MESHNRLHPERTWNFFKIKKKLQTIFPLLQANTFCIRSISANGDLCKKLWRECSLFFFLKHNKVCLRYILIRYLFSTILPCYFKFKNSICYSYYVIFHKKSQYVHKTLKFMLNSLFLFIITFI